MFHVTFKHIDGTFQTSSVSQSRRQATNRAKWLASQNWTAEVAVFKGQAGGERVATLKGAE
jgi:hypothetical protein